MQSVQKSAIEPKMPAYPNVGPKHSHTVVGMTTLFFISAILLLALAGEKLLAP
jgi:hypothetical protein